MAVAKTLGDLDVRAGGRIAFTRIEHAWVDTGLRLSDLRDAIRMLVDQGLIAGCEVEGRLGFQLTDRGHQRLYHGAVAPGFTQRLFGSWTLLRARHRSWRPSTSAMARRTSDPAH